MVAPVSGKKTQHTKASAPEAPKVKAERVEVTKTENSKAKKQKSAKQKVKQAVTPPIDWEIPRKTLHASIGMSTRQHH